MQIDARRRHGRLLLVAGLGATIALSWLYLVRMNAGMVPAHGSMATMAMPAMSPSVPKQFLTAFVMWGIMMVAMMLPTALPALKMYDNLARRRAAHTGKSAPVEVFAAGYIAAWIGYSVVLATGQVALVRVALLTPMLESASIVLSAVILLSAGVFQFTAFKDNCLSKCRTPFAFFLAEWRDGKAGALRVGFKHGTYCVGCCWVVMAVMFVVGAMNLAWMGALTLFMLGEKVAPAHWRIREVSGVVLVLWGLVVLAPLVR